MHIKRCAFILLGAALCVLTGLVDPPGTSVRAQSIHHAQRQAVSSGGGRGTSEHYGIAHTGGQPAADGIGNTDLYELISGVYGDVTVVTAIEGAPLASLTRLYQNYPNPFNPTTMITYSVGSRGRAVVEVFNVKGERVRVLVDETKDPGTYRAIWDGKNENSQPVASGIYLCRLRTGANSSAIKMLIIR